MFANIDISRWPQKVRIEWEMLTPRDDCNDRPDERDEGFWPSRNERAAGYVESAQFEEQQRLAEERMAAWEADEWEYVGVVAQAAVYIPIGGNSFRIMTLQSAGCWGIESDAGDYLKEVFEEEKASLMGELETLGKALADGEFVAA